MCTPLPTGVYYVVYVPFLIAFLINKGARWFLVNNYREDFIARSFLLVWIYGVILGFAMGNNPSYVVANFAGLLFYSWYFVLVKEKPDVETLIKIILVGGCVLSVFSIIQFIAYVNGYRDMPLSNLIDRDMGSTGQLRVYIATLCIAYVLFACTLCKVLFREEKYNFINHSFLWLIISSVSLLFVSASKGFMFGVLYLLFVIVLFYFYKTISGRMSIAKILLFFMCFIPILYYFLDYFEYVNIIFDMFSEDDTSNIARYEQMTYMLEDLSVFGRGLGSLIPGTQRSVDAPYGYELSYINIVHKFGFFSLFIFWGWFFMAKKSITGFLKKKDNRYYIIVFSSLGYLFPSVGNPLIFGPNLVVLTATSLYILRTLR